MASVHAGRMSAWLVGGTTDTPRGRGDSAPLLGRHSVPLFPCLGQDEVGAEKRCLGDCLSRDIGGRAQELDADHGEGGLPRFRLGGEVCKPRVGVGAGRGVTARVE